MRIGTRLSRATPSPWRSICRTPRVREEEGFTLIEMVIVSLVLPIIIGAMTLSLIAIFSTQGSVSSRLQGSGDAQTVSANYEKDVQSAALITADNSSTVPAPCETSAQAGDPQVLGLQLGSGQTGTMQTEISYVEVPVGNLYSLVRNSCQIGSTIPVTSTVISTNVASGLAATVTCDATLTGSLTSGTSYGSLSVSSLPDTVGYGDQVKISTGGSSPTSVTFTASAVANPSTHAISVNALSPSSNFPAGSQVVDSSWSGAGSNNCGANSGWVAAASVTGVTLPVTEPGSAANQYKYQLTALPGASSPASGATPVVTPELELWLRDTRDGDLRLFSLLRRFLSLLHHAGVVPRVSWISGDFGAYCHYPLHAHLLSPGDGNLSESTHHPDLLRPADE